MYTKFNRLFENVCLTVAVRLAIAFAKVLKFPDAELDEIPGSRLFLTNVDSSTPSSIYKKKFVATIEDFKPDSTDPRCIVGVFRGSNKYEIKVND